jgi:hypothetical protein
VFLHGHCYSREQQTRHLTPRFFSLTPLPLVGCLETLSISRLYSTRGKIRSKEERDTQNINNKIECIFNAIFSSILNTGGQLVKVILNGLSISF